MAVRELRESILSGDLQPGTRLILAELAERTSTSIMPVREAVRRLEAEGLVEQVPHRGAQVRPVSVPDLEDLYRVRIPLETLAVRLAAARFGEDDYERLSRVLVEYREAYERGGDARGREMHAAFHLGLYEVSQSRWLMHTITPLFNVADRYQRLSSVLRGSLESRYQEHERILECCRQRDAEAAAEALEDHLRKTMNVIKAELDGSVEDATSSADEETGGTVGA